VEAAAMGMKMKFGKSSPFLLAPSQVLHGYPLSPTCEGLFARATALARERGCCRLTTSLLLFAMVEFGERNETPSVLRSVWRYTLGSQPEAYRGIQAAYYGWYEHSCDQPGRRSESGTRETITGYILSILQLAERQGNPIQPEHLLRARTHFVAAYHEHGYTETGPGHSVLLSGRHPNNNHKLKRCAPLYHNSHRKLKHYQEIISNLKLLTLQHYPHNNLHNKQIKTHPLIKTKSTH